LWDPIGVAATTAAVARPLRWVARSAGAYEAAGGEDGRLGSLNRLEVRRVPLHVDPAEQLL
jgi:hypothetical protein